MSRPTDTHRGARLAYDVAREELTQPSLFPPADSEAQEGLEALWASIFDSAEQTLLEERWAAEARREATA